MSGVKRAADLAVGGRAQVDDVGRGVVQRTAHDVDQAALAEHQDPRLRCVLVYVDARHARASMGETGAFATSRDGHTGPQHEPPARSADRTAAPGPTAGAGAAPARRVRGRAGPGGRRHRRARAPRGRHQLRAHRADDRGRDRGGRARRRDLRVDEGRRHELPRRQRHQLARRDARGSRRPPEPPGPVHAGERQQLRRHRGASPTASTRSSGRSRRSPTGPSPATPPRPSGSSRTGSTISPPTSSSSRPPRRRSRLRPRARPRCARGSRRARTRRSSAPARGSGPCSRRATARRS